MSWYSIPNLLLLPWLTPQVLPANMKSPFQAGWITTTALNMLGQTVTSTVGIGQTISPTVKVYPNPFVNELFIDARHMPANASAGLYDMNGRKLMSIILDGQTLYLGHLNPGVYILHVEGQAFRIVKK